MFEQDQRSIVSVYADAAVDEDANIVAAFKPAS